MPVVPAACSVTMIAFMMFSPRSFGLARWLYGELRVMVGAKNVADRPNGPFRRPFRPRDSEGPNLLHRQAVSDGAIHGCGPPAPPQGRRGYGRPGRPERPPV